MIANEYIGRFAPSPSGRMHLGNVYAALMAWLFAKKAGGAFLLRIEDIDFARCKEEYIYALIDDLRWVGITFDEARVIRQSLRTEYYEKALFALREKGLLYPCFCTRADLRIASAPHDSDGRIIYNGHCRNISINNTNRKFNTTKYSYRCILPDKAYLFADEVYGEQSQNPFRDWGDIVVKRADLMYAYQLAVSVDDGESGINHIVRGRDLLSSVCVQEYIKSELGYKSAKYAHIPLLLAPDGKRLSKREKSLDIGNLRKRYAPEELIGLIASFCGIIKENKPLSAKELISEFSPEKLKQNDIYIKLEE